MCVRSLAFALLDHAVSSLKVDRWQELEMNVVRCPSCGETMKRNGKTSAGRTRWRCRACGASATGHVDNSAKRLDEFLGWLLSKERQADMPGAGRTFRRRTQEFWHLWPLPPVTGEVCRVVFVDGIYLARNVCVLVARSEEHVLGWYVARSENSRAYKALMARMAPPDVVVTDGGSGFQKARRQLWPDTRVQRCAFHAFEQVKRYTTTRPRTQAGVDLYALAKELLRVEDSEQAAAWLAAYAGWCSDYDEFLREETTNEEGRTFLTHERLVKARNSLTALVRQGTLFTYVDPDLTEMLGALPATNNAAESLNAQLRHMLREHRGLSLERRIKAVYWWCYMHTECPMPAAKILKVMPTDRSIAQEMRAISYENRASMGPQRWGDGLVWEELHRSTPWRRDWD
jgi:ribosomal protein L37AE/L43A